MCSGTSIKGHTSFTQDTIRDASFNQDTVHGPEKCIDATVTLNCPKGREVPL